MDDILNRSFVDKYFIGELILLTSLLVFIFNFQMFESWFALIWKDYQPSVVWAPLYELTGDYLVVVLASSSISFIVAFSLGGVLVHVYHLESLKDLVTTIADFGTTFPTIAVIALLVPVLGYGFKPVVAA